MEPLTPQQAQMVALTTQGQSQIQIAKTLGVSRQTIIRWGKLPHVQSAIAEANAAAQRGVAEQQQQQYKEIARAATLTTQELIEKLAPAAVKVVASIMARQDAKDSDKLKAAELLAKWSGLGQTANQPQQTSEQVLNLYLNNLSANTQNNHVNN